MPLRVSTKSPWAGKKGRSGGYTPKGRYPVVDKSARTMDGVVFDSKTEMMRYAHLQLGVRAGLIKNLKRQVEFKVFIGGKLFCTYTADATYEEHDGHDWVWVVEETKSAGTIREQDYHLRKRAAELYHGFTVREYVST